MAPSSKKAPRHAGLWESVRQFGLRKTGVAGTPQIDQITPEVGFCWTPGSNNPSSVLLTDKRSDSLAFTDPGSMGLLQVSREKNEAMEAYRREHGLRPRWMLLTHQHADHVGNGLWKGFLDNIYAHSAGFQYLLDPDNWAVEMARLSRLGQGEFKNAFPLLMLSKIPGATRPSWHAYRQIVYGRGLEPFVRKENDGLLTPYPANGHLELGNLEIEVLQTPGHCPDEVALNVFSRGKEILIVGDIIRPQRRLAIDPVPSAYAPEGNPYDIITSLELLLDQHADVLLPAHGMPIIGHRKVEHVLSASLEMTKLIRDKLEQAWDEHPSWKAQQIGNAVFGSLGLADPKLLGLDERTTWAASVNRIRKEMT